MATRDPAGQGISLGTIWKCLFCQRHLLERAIVIAITVIINQRLREVRLAEIRRKCERRLRSRFRLGEALR